MTPIAIVALVALVTKICTLIGIGLYTVFSGIMIRQEQLMAAVLEEGFEPILRLLTILHFAAAVSLFILAIIIL